jgi:hypothetical protein
MTTATQHLESIGHLCASIQSPYATVRRTVDKLGLVPAVTINGIDHFDAEQCERIADAIRQTQKETDDEV